MTAPPFPPTGAPPTHDHPVTPPENPTALPTYGSLTMSDPSAFGAAMQGALGAAMPAALTLDPLTDDGSALHTEEPVAPEQPDPTAEAERRQLARSAIVALYGAECPLVKEIDGGTIEPRDWARWAPALWARHRQPMQPILLEAACNRLFRSGSQWIAQKGGQWREPPAPKDAARLVHNMMKPALELHQQVVSEQRPGWRLQPTKQTADSEKKATAQQRAVEYQYTQQKMRAVQSEASFWAGTDGVSFLLVEWDAERGPWDERQGPDGAPRRERMGDLKTSVKRIEQVRVSANATQTEAPSYWIVRSVIARAEAVARYGSQFAKTTLSENSVATSGAAGVDDLPMPGTTNAVSGGDRGWRPPSQLLSAQETVDCFHVFCEPSEFLPDGAMLVVCGEELVSESALPWGVVPLIPWRDGSTDPAFYPVPRCSDWRDHQKRVNALLSKVYENIRLNASGGRLLTRPGAIKQETLVGGVLSLLEVQAGVAMNEAVVPVPAFSILGEALEQLKFEIQAFEQKSGWNDTTRGSFSDDQSGRSILAQRETVERIFTPDVTAAAEAMTKWAEVCLHGMRWGYDLPRWIGATGGDRPDLAMSVQSEDFDGICDVSIDPETLMPMPRSLRLFLLDQLHDKGAMDTAEYRDRLPFAFTDALTTPKHRKEARARRIAMALKQGQQPPEVRWTDDPAIVQSVLEEEILDVDKPGDPQWMRTVQGATALWAQYAQLAIEQSGGVPPGAPTPQGGGAPQGDHLPPDQQPFPSTNPGVAAAPASVLAAENDEQKARGFDGLLGQ